MIAAGALVVLAVVVTIWFVLLRRYGGQGASVQLDAIRTAGTLVIGTGGAAALLLTARRQRYTELTLLHTDRDATERRITELYTKAADQLGSEQAPVRLAGLYALERLAHSTVEHRQTIVDVICAYLRMPYIPPQPSASAPGRSYLNPRPAWRRRVQTLASRPPHATFTPQESRQQQAEREQLVRLTAQNILFRNLRGVAQRRRRWWRATAPPAAPAWPGTRLDLTGALLLEFSLAECQLDGANFTRTQFSGGASFELVHFTGRVDFGDAQFAGRASFGFAQFAEKVAFRDAHFTDVADFGLAQFTGRADFEGAAFADAADFGLARFTGGAAFGSALFTDMADFRGARFSSGRVDFGDTRFTGGASFSTTAVAHGIPLRPWRVFSEAAYNDLFRARLRAVGFRFVCPRGWRIRAAQRRIGEDPAFMYLAEVKEGHPRGT